LSGAGKLHTGQEESYCVVPDSDVVFKDVPQVNEDVKFFYDSSTSSGDSYPGKVIKVGGR